MKIIHNKNKYVLLRLDENEELINSVAKFTAENKITAGIFTGIGSAKELVCSYYNISTKQFEDHILSENIEIVSLTGNIAILDDKHLIHAHGVFSKKDFSTIGGHVKKLIISATCEITLHILEGRLVRKKDLVTGLNLLQ